MADAWGTSWGASSAWGTSWLAGVAPAAGATGGGRIVGGTFSRGQWRDVKKRREEQWRAAVEAQEKAEAKALEIKSAKAQAKAYQATQLANQAISLAALNEEVNLTKLTNALEAVAEGQRTAEKLAQVRRISQEIIRNIEDEEDEEDAIMFLLMH